LKSSIGTGETIKNIGTKALAYQLGNRNMMHYEMKQKPFPIHTIPALFQTGACISEQFLGVA
jgi:ribosomal protein S6